MKNKYIVVVVGALLLLVLIAACSGPNELRNVPTEAGFTANFWNGLWDGFALPVSLIWSLFDNQVGIYQIHNDGRPYDAGFVIGAWGIFAVVLAARQGGRSNQVPKNRTS